MAEKRKRDDPKQSERFEETAKKVEAENSADALQLALEKIASLRQRNLKSNQETDKSD